MPHLEGACDSDDHQRAFDEDGDYVCSHGQLSMQTIRDYLGHRSRKYGKLVIWVTNILAVEEGILLSIAGHADESEPTVEGREFVFGRSALTLPTKSKKPLGR